MLFFTLKANYFTAKNRRSNIKAIIVTILLGFRYSASSIPLISSAGVAIGAGSIPSILIFAICRNPVISNVLIR
jgi:hypothetical protein